MQFRAKNAGYSRGLSQVCATSYWAPCDEDGRTESHETITSQTQFLPLIDNHFFLINGDPRARLRRAELR